MPFVEVAVNSPGGRNSTFVYSYESRRLPSQNDSPATVSTSIQSDPSNDTLDSSPLPDIGSLVLVPFGSTHAQGIIVDHVDRPPPVQVRPIIRLFDERPVISRSSVALARWIAAHYCCSLIDALALMLPPGVAQRPETFLSLVSDAPPLNEVSEGEFLVLTALKAKKRLPLSQIRQILTEHRLGRQADRIARRLAERGVVQRETSIRPARIRPRFESFVRLVGSAADTESALGELSRAPRQRDVLTRLLHARPGGETPLALLREEGLGNAQVLGALRKRGLITVDQREVRRDPLVHRNFPRSLAPPLTQAQDAALREILEALDHPGFHPFLLLGITGSGKTEVYLRMIDHVLTQGKRAIVLVPEISLTPQTIHRFAGRFPNRLAILHSRLTAGERFDEWRRIREGAADVIIGSRSACFAPVPNLGAIIVDEEHEWTYKQEKTPRYHARDVALKLAEISGLTVVLGSATPALETYYGTQRGKIRLLRLPERVEVARQNEGSGSVPANLSPAAAAQAAGLPPVEVVDLRAELRAGNRTIFSNSLKNALELSLHLREQAILFLNRRGDSTFVLCRDCGYVMRCERCDAPLVYHSDLDDLVCHLCDARHPMPGGCPSCWGDHIRYFGIGTQKLEAETRRAFPSARVLRWDRDAAHARGAHEELLHQFVNHEADVLVGTQMIAKGLDLPRVTLVGIISADTSLHLPDFRAAERTFQLLTQVAGRAGRGPLGGKVVLQTYSPEHYCIQAACNHDYASFYTREIEFRRQHGYPPFGELARLVYVNYGESRVQREAEQMAGQIRQRLHRDGWGGIDLIGPAPAFRRKIRGRYRWQIILRGRDLSTFLAHLTIPLGWTVDVDPVSTL